MSETDQKTIDALRRKRGNIKATLTRLEVYSTNINQETTAEDICIRLEILEKAYNEFKDIEDRLFAYPNQPSEFAEFEERYILLKGKLRAESKKRNNVFHDLQQQFSSTMQTFAQQQQDYFNILQDRSFSLNNNKDEIRLPKITIPNFNGNYSDFPSFKDLYEATIHNNDSLSKINKFKYLQGFLTGEAANMVKHVTISEANYDSTWQKIVKRYDHKDHIMANLIRQFLSQPRINGSSKEIRRMADTTEEVLRGLSALGDAAETRDGWLIYLLLEKCDEETRKAWALKVVNQQCSTIDEFTEFLNDRSNALERAEPIQRNKVRINPAVSSANVAVTTICPLCDQQHLLYKCDRFLEFDVSSRRGFIADKRLCFNCMRSNHRSEHCKLRMRCFKCNRKHNVLLHTDEIEQEKPTASNSVLSDTNELSVAQSSTSVEPILRNCSTNLNTQAILPTAIVKVRDGLGQMRQVRVLLDSGSQASFIDEHVFQRLYLTRKNAQIPIAGLATSGIVTKGVAQLEIMSRFSNSTINAETFILEKLPLVLPSLTFGSDQLHFISKLELADPEFYKTGKIDMLLGADIFFDVLREGKQTNSDSSIVAQNTMFGYVVSGKPKVLIPSTVHHISLNIELKLDEILRRFWEIEEPPTTKQLSIEEVEAEKHFASHVRRDLDGRFVVKIPFKENINKLGNSFHIAQKRFYNMERKLARNEELSIDYKQFMAEYLQLHHMEEIAVKDISLADNKCFYLPHHAVVKTSSSTTKVRVVFDGSSKSSTSTSLNDVMMVGPTIQSSLWDILVRFRAHKYVVTADIEKMYRQVRVAEDDTNYQRILWRENPDATLKHYKLTTVTYGTASAPFLATRCLLQLAYDNMKNHPEAARIIENDFYVDDLLTGSDSIESMLKLKNAISEILTSAGFKLRKWSSNSPLICENDPVIAICDERTAIKILGLQWSPQFDFFSFKVQAFTMPEVTKRIMLSDASTIFDPLGWLSPSTILIKILFQQLWLQKLEWDDQLPEPTKTSYIKIRNEFQCFENLKIPRWIQCSEQIEFHVFADASEKAYAAAVYCRSIYNDNAISVSLLTAKTKVAPIKQKSLPRLELCAAVLGTNLLMAVSTSMKHVKHSIHAWTDSSIVLSWLSDHPSRWTPFVGNRTAQIITLCPRENWSHVKSSDNPTDIATRGLFPSQLAEYKLWWHGPEWLSKPETMWPTEREFEKISDTVEERRKKCTTILHTEVKQTMLTELITKVSSYSKMIRVVARIMRFLQNFKAKNLKCTRELPINSSYLTSAELSRAEEIIIQHVQHCDFKDDIERLKKNLNVGKQSNLKGLNPFIDKNGILRVGGRLDRASCSFAVKHPIILHKKSILSKIIATHIHLKNLHPGPSLSFHLLRQKFWIVNGRSMINQIVKMCVTCVRYRGQSPSQLMGQLPEVRVNPARPFENTGVDYTGAISLANKRGRGAKISKGYIAIFICLVTKAIHIEVVTDCTTDGFIAALRRFIARRGVPSNLYSDNGTNFVGTERKLRQMYQIACRHVNDIHKLTSSNKFITDIGTYLAGNQINWHYTPPLAPHFAGIWESAVKSVKTHLAKATGSINLTYEELATLLCNIEAILNSRPITVLSTSDESYEALTPGHFLVGAPITSLPEPYDADVSPIKLSKVWSIIQQRTFTFWKRFSVEYLHNLHQRHKWQRKEDNIKIGDLVLIKEQYLPPCQWAIGRIKDVHPGQDGHIRVVSIRTANSEYKRPLNKIVILPIEKV